MKIKTAATLLAISLFSFNTFASNNGIINLGERLSTVLSTVNSLDKGSLISVEKDGNIGVMKVELLNYSPFQWENSTTLRFMPSDPAGNGELYRMDAIFKGDNAYKQFLPFLQKTNLNHCKETNPKQGVKKLTCKYNGITTSLVTNGSQTLIEKINDADYQMVVDASK